MINRVMNIEIGFKAIGAAIAIGELKQLAGAMTGLADTATRIQSRISSSTDSASQTAYAMKQIRDIANETRMPLDAIATLYGRLQSRADTLGISQNQVARVTENVSKALKLQGVSVAEADSVLRQFSQAMQKGKLNGDEFNSMAENAPILLDILAASIAKVDSGPKFEKVRASLKEMGAEGKVTAKMLADALGAETSKALDKLEERFKKLPMTFEEASTIIKNTAAEMTGALIKGLDIQDALRSLNNTSSDSFQDMLDSCEDLGRAIRGLFATMFGSGEEKSKDAATVIRGEIEGLTRLIEDMEDAWNWIEDLPTRFQRSLAEARGDIRETIGLDRYGDEPPETHKTETQKTQERRVREREQARRDRAERDRLLREGAANGDKHGPGYNFGEDDDDKGAKNKQKEAYDRFVAELRKRGVRINSGYRTYQEQADLYRRLGPGQAAAPGRSEHNHYKGIDVGPGVSNRTIQDAAAAAGVNLDRSFVHQGTGRHRHIGFSAGNGTGKSWEEQQADAAERYDAALGKLKQSIDEVGMSKRDVAALDELERAGLDRNIAATDERSKAIIAEARALYDKQEAYQFITEGQKQLAEEEAATRQKQAEQQQQAMGGYEAELRAIGQSTQARLDEVMAKRDWNTATALEIELRDKILDQIMMQGQIEKDMVKEKKAKDFSDDMTGLGRSMQDMGLDMALLKGGNPEEIALQKQMLEVERWRQDTIRQFAQKYGEGTTEFLQAVQAINSNATMQIDVLRETAKQEQFRSYVGELQNLFQGLFTDARGTMKQFFTELLTKLLTAIAYSIIFKTNMASGLQMSGGGGGLIGGILGTFLTSLAGGIGGGIGGGGGAAGGAPSGNWVGPRFANGGTMRGGQLAMINERGQELFMPGVDGRMITNKQLMSAMGSTSLSLGNTVINVNNNGGSMDERKLAMHVAAQQERSMRNLIRQEMGKKV